ncbi:major facilitator superfamily domain-containing protein [Obelidium mucronatum]|nr:major facilitator superfamily domain-containing protein [Obelidium mucronatum]
MSENEINANTSLFKQNRIFDVIVLAFAFLCIFTAFSVSQNMASTVLPSSEVAFPTLGVLYLSFALFNLFGAGPFVDRIGSRAAMFVGALTYTTFDFSNVGAILLSGDSGKQLDVLIPAAILIGAGAAVLWSAQGEYVIRCASKQTIGRYSGIFFGIMNASNVFGPLLTATLLQMDVDKVTSFLVLSSVGALGPIILIYIWTRPEPSNPSAPLDQTPAEIDSTPLLLRAFKIIVSKKMLMVAVLVYLNSFEQAFNSATLQLFIKTDSPTDDLRTKLYVAAAYGAALTTGAFAIGPITDRVNNPTLIIAVDSAIHLGALVALWVHPNPYNNLALLYPCNIIFAISDATLNNQVYKIIAGLFAANSTAYAAYKFHASFMMGVCFFVSKALLKSDGMPNMAAWVPLLSVLFVGAIISTWISTKEINWREQAQDEEVLSFQNLNQTTAALIPVSSDSKQ